MAKAAHCLVILLLVLGAALKAHAMPEAMSAPLVCEACCALSAGDADADEALGKPAGAWSVGVVRSAPMAFPDAGPRLPPNASKRVFSPALTRLLL